jgi:hypothetical protein
MDKNAKSVLGQLVSSANPFAMFLDNYKVDLLPQLSKDETTNKMIYNAMVAGGTTMAITAILKALSHKINARKWDKKNKQIVTDKLNALYPITAPNYDKDVTTTTAIRKIGLNDLAKNASDSKESPGFLQNLADGWETTLKGSVPLLTAMTAAVVTPSLIKDRLVDKDEEELNAQIQTKRNELDALRAKLIDLQLPKKANMDKQANFLSGISAYALAAIASALVPGAFLLTNNYLNKNDRDRKIMNAGLDAASRNLTNIPQRLSLQLTPEGRPALNKEDQKYVQELKTLANQAAIANVEDQLRRLEAPKSNVDFDDKITKIKKDALFS